MNLPRTATAVAVAAVALAVVTACSASSTPVPQRSAVHTSAIAAAPTPIATSARSTARPARTKSAATSHPATSPTARPRTTSAAPEPTRTPPSAPTGPAACPDGTVGVSAERGGALPGQELALLTFTNRSSSTCSITGFPGVELFAHDTVIGKPAVRSASTVRTLTVTPGAHVTAMLHDDTRCNADLSDQVGVYVPNQTAQQRIPLELRACTMTIDPVRR